MEQTNFSQYKSCYSTARSLKLESLMGIAVHISLWAKIHFKDNNGTFIFLQENQSFRKTTSIRKGNKNWDITREASAFESFFVFPTTTATQFDKIPNSGTTLCLLFF